MDRKYIHGIEEERHSVVVRNLNVLVSSSGLGNGFIASIFVCSFPLSRYSNTRLEGVSKSFRTELYEITTNNKTVTTTTTTTTTTNTR
jgi:hypothetical protein